MAVLLTNYITPVIAANGHADNDALGPVTAIPSVPKSGTIMSYTILNDADSTFDFELYIFGFNVGGVADDAVFVLTDTEAQGVIGIFDELTGTNVWQDAVDLQIYHQENRAMPYYTPDGILYFQIALRDAYTPGAVDDIHVRFGIVY